VAESLAKHHGACGADVRRRAKERRAQWAGAKRAEPLFAFLCPITLHVMSDPVVLGGDRYTYERSAIEAWLQKKATSPMTNLDVHDATLTPNVELRAEIAAFRRSHA
jgi:hypothetical protein